MSGSMLVRASERALFASAIERTIERAIYTCLLVRTILLIITPGPGMSSQVWYIPVLIMKRIVDW